jgi:hypothetical protein
MYVAHRGKKREWRQHKTDDLRRGSPHDRAQEKTSDCQQDRRGAQHPNQEDVRVGDKGLASRSNEPQDRLVELDADLHLSRLADRVDPERALDVGTDLVGKRPVEKVEEGFGLRNPNLLRPSSVSRAMSCLVELAS